jgi:hypothetical protein
VTDAVKRFIEMPPDYLLRPASVVVAETNPTTAEAGAETVRANREAFLAERHEEKFASYYADEVVKLRARRAAKRKVDSEELADGDIAIPAPTPLTTLLDEEDEDVQWRIEGVWPRGGHILLAAGAKSGKTTTIGNVVRSLADGDRLFRVYPVEPVTEGTIAILDYEMPRRTVKRWLRDQGIRNQERLVIWTERGLAERFDLREADLQKMWAEQLRIAEARIWIIDCLSPVLSSLGIEENSNTEVGKFLGGLTATAEAGGVEEVLLVHHMGHGPERSRGASRLIGWADANWKIVRARDEKNPNAEPEADAPRFFAANGRDVEVREGRLLFDPATRHLTYVEGGRAKSESDQAMARLLVYVRDNPGQSSDAVVAKLQSQGVGRNDARKAVDSAKTKGYVLIAEGKGRARRLEITPMGRDNLRILSLVDEDGGDPADLMSSGVEVYCHCGCYIEPPDTDAGYTECLPCRRQRDAA